MRVYIGSLCRLSVFPSSAAGWKIAVSQVDMAYDCFVADHSNLEAEQEPGYGQKVFVASQDGGGFQNGVFVVLDSV